jgi:branched-chain amino acid transport system ATP-binding protein
MTPPAVTELVLAVRDLVVRYGAIEALHGVSLEVRRGQIVCLIGANGAGKTTLLRAISAIVPTARGAIEYQNPQAAAPDRPVALHRTKAHQIVALGISHVPEGRGVFHTMTVEENLDIGAFLRRDKAAINRDREHVFTLFPRIKERRRQIAGTLSGGEQQMLAIGRALMSRPQVLLLDEPSLGLAPLLVEQIFTVIRDINQEGVTVLLVEQNAHLALKVAHHAYVLETGTISLQGPAHEVAGNAEVQRAYLGGD